MRFTIRDVLWLTVVVALACGWWLHHRQEQALRLRLASELEVERAEKARMLEYSSEITARLRQVDRNFDQPSPGGGAGLLGGAPAAK